MNNIRLNQFPSVGGSGCTSYTPGQEKWNDLRSTRSIQIRHHMLFKMTFLIIFFKREHGFGWVGMRRIWEELGDGKEYDKKHAVWNSHSHEGNVVYSLRPEKKGVRGFGHIYPSQVPSVVTVKVSRHPLLRLCYHRAHFCWHTEPRGQLQPGSQRRTFQRNSCDRGVQLSSPKKTWFPDFIRSKRISFPGPMKWVSRRSTRLTYWDMFPYTEFRWDKTFQCFMEQLRLNPFP